MCDTERHRDMRKKVVLTADFRTLSQFRLNRWI